MVIFGPTIMDQANNIGVGEGIVAITFGCRAIGSAIGGMTTGVFLDKLPQYSFLVLTIIYIFSTACA